ncbi:hypothetical protein HDU82_008859 [Entophlyctis luteolus]|nr:hypothetical protein HDU82_008859 [Entophlyctis luteolus]
MATGPSAGADNISTDWIREHTRQFRRFGDDGVAGLVEASASYFAWLEAHIQSITNQKDNIALVTPSRRILDASVDQNDSDRSMTESPPDTIKRVPASNKNREQTPKLHQTVSDFIPPSTIKPQKSQKANQKRKEKSPLKNFDGLAPLPSGEPLTFDQTQTENTTAQPQLVHQQTAEQCGPVRDSSSQYPMRELPIPSFVIPKISDIVGDPDANPAKGRNAAPPRISKTVGISSFVAAAISGAGIADAVPRFEKPSIPLFNSSQLPSSTKQEPSNQTSSVNPFLTADTGQTLLGSAETGENSKSDSVTLGKRSSPLEDRAFSQQRADSAPSPVKKARVTPDDVNKEVVLSKPRSLDAAPLPVRVVEKPEMKNLKGRLAGLKKKLDGRGPTSATINSTHDDQTSKGANMAQLATSETVAVEQPEIFSASLAKLSKKLGVTNTAAEPNNLKFKICDSSSQSKEPEATSESPQKDSVEKTRSVTQLTAPIKIPEQKLLSESDEDIDMSIVQGDSQEVVYDSLKDEERAKEAPIGEHQNSAAGSCDWGSGLLKIGEKLVSNIASALLPSPSKQVLPSASLSGTKLGATVSTTNLQNEAQKLPRATGNAASKVFPHAQNRVAKTAAEGKSSKIGDASKKMNTTKPKLLVNAGKKQDFPSPEFAFSDDSDVDSFSEPSRPAPAEPNFVLEEEKGKKQSCSSPNTELGKSMGMPAAVAAVTDFTIPMAKATAGVSAEELVEECGTPHELPRHTPVATKSAVARKGGILKTATPSFDAKLTKKEKAKDPIDETDEKSKRIKDNNEGYILGGLFEAPVPMKGFLKASQAKKESGKTDSLSSEAKGPATIVDENGELPEIQTSDEDMSSSDEEEIEPPKTYKESATSAKTPIPQSAKKDTRKQGVPSWVETPNLMKALVSQTTRDPDAIFGAVKPLSLEDVFKEGRVRRKFRDSMAGNWIGHGALTVEEEEEYKKLMGYTND